MSKPLKICSTPYFSAHTFDERRQRGENTNWYFDQFCGRCLTHNPQCPSPLHGLELTVRTDLCYLFGFSYWTNSFFFLALFIPYPVWKKCECRKIINPNRRIIPTTQRKIIKREKEKMKAANNKPLK